MNDNNNNNNSNNNSCRHIMKRTNNKQTVPSSINQQDDYSFAIFIHNTWYEGRRQRHWYTRVHIMCHWHYYIYTRVNVYKWYFPFTLLYRNFYVCKGVLEQDKKYDNNNNKLMERKAINYDFLCDLQCVSFSRHSHTPS